MTAIDLLMIANDPGDEAPGSDPWSTASLQAVDSLKLKKKINITMLEGGRRLKATNGKMGHSYHSHEPVVSRLRCIVESRRVHQQSQLACPLSI